MDRNKINEKLEIIQRGITAIMNVTENLKYTDPARYSQNYETLLVESCILAERCACNLRKLIFNTTSVSKRSLMSVIALENNIEIRYNEETHTLSIQLPTLLPKKKQPINSEYLTDTLYFALDAYIKAHELEKFRECTVAFIHYYDESTTNWVRDYDNMEVKQVLDTIAAFALVDDTGRLCDIYHTSKAGNDTYTEIIISEKNNFLTVYTGLSDTVQKIS